MKDKLKKRIWIACSGGVDSVVLAHLLTSQGFNTGLLHCNFNLRGDESNGDEAFVKTFASSLNIPMEVKQFNTPELVKQNTGNTQIIAREIRYQWFAEIAKRDNALIALGHHQDDQVETFLIQLERGGGIRGLCAMQKVQGIYLRPLLTKDRSWIVNYAQHQKLTWREDSSNSSIKYKRNFYRHKLLPLMKKNKAYGDVLNLVSLYQKLQHSIFFNVKIAVETIKEKDIIKCENWLKLSTIEQKEILYQLDIPRNQISEITKLVNAQKGAKIAYTNFIIVNDGGSIVIKKETPQKQAAISVENISIIDIDYTQQGFFIDNEKVKGQLNIRPWKEGDRFTPLGLKGSKRLSKYLNGLAINAAEKQNVLVITDEEKIVAVENGAPSELVKITKKTKEVLHLTIHK